MYKYDNKMDVVPQFYHFFPVFSGLFVHCVHSILIINLKFKASTDVTLLVCCCFFRGVSTSITTKNNWKYCAFVHNKYSVEFLDETIWVPSVILLKLNSRKMKFIAVLLLIGLIGVFCSFERVKADEGKYVSFQLNIERKIWKFKSPQSCSTRRKYLYAFEFFSNHFDQKLFEFFENVAKTLSHLSLSIL